MILYYLRSMADLITRLAPTPSGFLHKGNAFNFLLSCKIASQQNSKVLLRIDDLDSQRVRDEYIEDIFFSLAWLGIDWDIGPSGVEDFKKNWSQTLRIGAYQKTLQLLRDNDLLFACNCSRKTLSVTKIYPGNCVEKKLPLHANNLAWRIKIDSNTSVKFIDNIKGETNIDISQSIGCAVMKRRDGVPAYQIASVTDDELWGVNTIVRGEDLLLSSALQLHLAEMLNYKNFAQAKFYHHPLLVNNTGGKLSKSKGDVSLKYMRENGMNAATILNEFEVWLKLHYPSI